MASISIPHGDVAKDLVAAESAAHNGPVFITAEDGRPRYVLMEIEEYQRLAGSGASSSKKTLLDLFDDSALSELPEDFEFPRLELELRPADLS